MYVIQKRVTLFPFPFCFAITESFEIESSRLPRLDSPQA